MERKKYESCIELTEQRLSFDNLIEENYTEKMSINNKNLFAHATKVYFCYFNNCGLVVKEDLINLTGSTPILSFTIAHENSLENIAATKNIIENKTKLKLKEIK